VTHPGERPTDDERIREFFLRMHEQGIFMASRGMGNLSTPMDESHIDMFVDAYKTTLERVEESAAST
jgi:glutamate-1-semialdehyde 2,1-aminomutase